MGAFDLVALKRILDAEILLEEEKKMWLRLGVYVSTTTKMSLGQLKSSLYDGAGNEVSIPPNVAKNVRRCIIEWWQVEKVKPRSAEKEVVQSSGNLDELENRRE